MDIVIFVLQKLQTPFKRVAMCPDGKGECHAVWKTLKDDVCQLCRGYVGGKCGCHCLVIGKFKKIRSCFSAWNFKQHKVFKILLLFLYRGMETFALVLLQPLELFRWHQSNTQRRVPPLFRANTGAIPR